MVADVAIERTGRNVARVRLTVRLHDIGFAFRQGVRAFEVRYRLRQLTRAEVAMSAMTIQARIAGMFDDALRVDVDGIVETTEICGAPTEPDDRVDIRGSVFVRATRGVELRFQLLPRGALRLRAIQRLSGE